MNLPKIGNKSRMFILAISTQFCIGDSNRAIEQGNKTKAIWNGKENKIVSISKWHDIV